MFEDSIWAGGSSESPGVEPEPDVMLPVQFFATGYTHPSHLPERRLVLAIMEQAIADFQTNAAPRTARGHRVFLDAAGWLASDDTMWPFSFLNSCDALGLHPGVIRAGMRRWWLLRRSGEIAPVNRTPFHNMRGTRRRSSLG